MLLGFKIKYGSSITNDSIKDYSVHTLNSMICPVFNSQPIILDFYNDETHKQIRFEQTKLREKASNESKLLNDKPQLINIDVSTSTWEKSKSNLMAQKDEKGI